MDVAVKSVDEAYEFIGKPFDLVEEAVFSREITSSPSTISKLGRRSSGFVSHEGQVYCKSGNEPTKKDEIAAKPKKPLNIAKTPLGINRYFLVSLYCVYCYTTGCVYWGWDGFEKMLLKSGAFQWLCESPESFRDIDGFKYPTCSDRNLAIMNMYTAAFASHFCFSAVAGTILDVAGPKICSLIGIVCNSFGFLLLAFASESVASYYPACIFIGVAADMGYLPTLSVGNLFPGNEGLIMSILGSVRSLSFSVPVVLSAVYNASDTYDASDFKKFCFGYIGLGCGLAAIISGLLIPMRAFRLPEDTPEEAKNPEHQEAAARVRRRSTYTGSMMPPVSTSALDLKEIGQEISGKNPDYQSRRSSYASETVVSVSSPEPGMEHTVQSAPSFIESVKRPEFLLIVPFFCLCLIRGEFYTKTHSDQLTTSSGKDVIFFFGIMNILSFLPGPIFGKLCDFIGILWVIFILNIVGIFSYLFLIFDNIACKGVSVVFTFIYTSFVLSNLYCYVADTFPIEHFGKLTGLASLCGGLFTLSSIGFALLSQEKLKHLGAYKCVPVDAIMIGFGFINIGLWYVMFRLKKKGKSKSLLNVVQPQEWQESSNKAK